MKLTKIIINPNMTIVGFMVMGKASEFGEVGDMKSERPMQLAHMMKSEFHNSQVLFSNGIITNKGRFQINQLGMVKVVGDELIPIENTVELTERFVRNNENIGFSVKFGDGSTNKYKYNDVMKLAEIFRPTNFVIKVNAQGRQFIAGKTGYPLSSLPVTVVGSTTNAKKTKSGAQPVSPVTGGTRRNDIDIMDVFSFVNECNGFIINFKDTKYETTSAEVTKAPESFRSLGVGEVGNPKLDFNETKFNASCKFKNPGVIEIPALRDSSGAGRPSFAGTSGSLIYTYVYRSKNIFFNGEHHLNRIGLIIPADKQEELLDKFSRSMAINEVTDQHVIDVVNRLINWKGSKIFDVDTSKLALISPNKYDSMILTSHALYKYTYDLAVTKIALKYLRGASKDLREHGFVGIPSNRVIAPQFELKSEAELEQLILAGVDIYSGAFTERGETVKTGSKVAGDPAVEVSYIIDGLDPKNFTYAKIVGDVSKNPLKVNELINKVQKVENMATRAAIISDLEVELNKKESSIKSTLWFHKTAMWLKANKLGVHQHDSKNWVVNTKKRTKATCYDCNAMGTEGLQLLVLNTDIVR